MSVRDFVCHMIQNCIYKHGQFSTLFFALGLDGAAPYDAPFPNPLYDSLHRAEGVRRERDGESLETFRAAFADDPSIPPAVIDATYERLSTRFSRGIPLRASDTLKSVMLLSQPENVLMMYGGVPTRWLAESIAEDAGLSTPPETWDGSRIETAGDLVRAVAGLALPG